MKRLLPLLLIVVSAGLFDLYVSPQYTTVKSLIEQKRQYSDAIEKAKELQVMRDELLTKYNALPKEDLAKLDRLLPQNINTVKLVADIASIGANYGLTVHDIVVKEVAADNAQEISLGGQKKTFQTATIAFKFSTSYPKLILFLKNLESSLQLIDVKNVSFDTKDDDGELLDYSVIIQTYWVQ